MPQSVLAPGVYLGSWEIHTIGGPKLFGARHTALALVDRSRTGRVVELIGWTATRFSVIRDSTHGPFYGSLSSYQWVAIAPVTAIGRIDHAISVVRMDFEGHPYWIADSNRFIGRVLTTARVRLDVLQLLAVGWAPAFEYHAP